MLAISYEFISGVMLGFEHVDKRMMGDDEDGWFIVIDLFIIRLLLERYYN